MTIRSLFCFLVVHLLVAQVGWAQVGIGVKTKNESVTRLFQERSPLTIQLQFSTKDLKKNTNDSTYFKSFLLLKNEESTWDSLKIKLRARGNHRRKTCYYAPLKLKIKKRESRGTLFEGNTKLKLVLPCLLEKDNDDLVVKEYMAYRIFELLSPYHYKARLANIEFNEEKGKRIKKRDLKAIILEDIDKVAKRHNGQTLTRKVHPLQQDDLYSLRNSFFQYLIGNTDFSTRGEHNQKLVYIDNKYVSIPFDFDMSGLVNASYATISGMENMKGSITMVTQRVYKGYKRDDELTEQVRQEYIASKDKIYSVMDDLKVYFQNPIMFAEAKDFVADFFEIMENDKKFKKYILDRARS
ncbi:MAG: hypothetical protein KJO52_04050, partial [Maribacter sp.]|nr:hypothetical protein [Maribacter sp.]